MEPEAKQKIRDSRVGGTQHLIQAPFDDLAAPAVLVSASAIGIYGSRGDEILTETSSTGEGFLAEVCQGMGKRSGYGGVTGHARGENPDRHRAG